MKKLLVLICLCSAFMLMSASVSAQPRPNKNWKDWFGQISGSYTIPQGEAGDVLDDGWSLRGGATYHPEDWPIGLVFELEYSELDFSREAIDFINDQLEPDQGSVTGGDVSTWGVTFNGTWSPSQSGKGFYIIAGIGVYRVEGKVTEQGLVYYPPVCSPWYWWCVPGGVGPGTFVKGSQSSTEFGWNAGIGWAFEVGLGSQLFIESRYTSIATDPLETEILPITVGFRW